MAEYSENNLDYKTDGMLDEEYESSFTESEKIVNALKVNKDEFTIDIGVVEFDTLLIPDPIKKSRKETYLGLSTSIAEMGILQPIHVMVTEGFADWVAEHGDEPYDGYKYILLDGFRRVWGGYKNGLSRTNAIIWDFKDKDRGADLAITLAAILNKNQRKSWNETWYLYQILESQSALTPGTLEYLLQLNPGDAMKLKDIMFSDYEEVKTELLSNKKTLDQAYSMLQKLRKDENQLVLDDNRGVADMEQAEGIIEKAGDERLSNDEVSRLLEMGDELDGDLSEEDFDELMGNNIQDEVQTVGERHPLDPQLRAAVLQRDGFKCAVTGRGEGLPTPIALSILNVHHKVPVHAGGTDSMDNLITVEQSVHTLIHVIERNMGKLGMSKEVYDALDDEQKKFISGTMKIARIAVEANKRLGKTRDQVRSATEDAIKFKMPGTDLRINQEALRSAN